MWSLSLALTGAAPRQINYEVFEYFLKQTARFENNRCTLAARHEGITTAICNLK